MSTEENLVTIINQHFINSGEKQRLLTLLKARLAETSWSDNYYAHCKETMNSKKDNFTLDELIQETSDYGKSILNNMNMNDNGFVSSLITHICIIN
ncbi:unnamed protein product [Cunninghamella blakesleeana]